MWGSRSSSRGVGDAAAVEDGAAVGGGAVVGGAVVGGAAVGAAVVGGSVVGVDGQSLPLSSAGGDRAARGEARNGAGGIASAVRLSANDQPSNVPGGGLRLPAPSVL